MPIDENNSLVVILGEPKFSSYTSVVRGKIFVFDVGHLIKTQVKGLSNRHLMGWMLVEVTIQ